MTDLIITFLLVGCLYSLCTIGLSISFRVLNYPDLTIEGSVIFGGIFAYYGLHWGFSPFLSILLGFIGGYLAGLMTAIAHNYLHVSKLLSGIITTAILYTINIRLLNGKSNIRFEGLKTIFNFYSNHSSNLSTILVLSIIIIFVCLLLILLFKSKLGYLFRVYGDNDKFITALGKNIKVINIHGLCISNGIIGIGGALLVQHKNIIDINLSSGLLVSCLASMVIGETLIAPKKIISFLFSCICGTIIYQMIIAIIFFSWSSQWDTIILASDVRLITGILLIVPALIKYNRTGQFPLFKSEW